MKLFNCTCCGQLIYFENNRCERCGNQLGFDAQQLELLPVVSAGGELYNIYEGGPRLYYYCNNHQYGVCNWLVDAGAGTRFCPACDLNHTIPDLNQPAFRARWRNIEIAKHRLIYSLLRLKLPVFSKKINYQTGLQFDFVADEDDKKVYTGHEDGVITINIAEADDLEREMARKAMEEVYRTVLGHFRHEVGHYYWDRLIDISRPYLEECRTIFGDDRADYGQAVQAHYANGAPADWPQHFISAYATTHPWEDWAETWAHYLHIMDTLETAFFFKIVLQPGTEIGGSFAAAITTDPYTVKNFNYIFKMWLPLSFMMNSLNRSMGLPDPYPFIIRQEVVEKLTFIHKVCQGPQFN